MARRASRKGQRLKRPRKSQGIEKCEKLVVRLEARRLLPLERLELGERFDLEGDMVVFRRAMVPT